MSQVQEKYIKKQTLLEWRFELRVRYLPYSLHDLYEKDRITFFYFFDQVSSVDVYVTCNFLGVLRNPEMCVSFFVFSKYFKTKILYLPLGADRLPQ